MNIAEEGSLTSRYCLVLEELHAEAVRQITPVQPSVDQQTQTHYAMEMRSGDIENLTSNVGDFATEFAMAAPNLVGLGPLDYFHVSPSASLEDLTGWDQFESMVSAHEIEKVFWYQSANQDYRQVFSGFNNL
ncbi:unnamed protein product [Aspergillus oryzae var. brunneus]|uniref:Unnamed protein product n=1 Tax=Aspergillus oryzae var. brunneus TaxID=332754 RepID=A0ABQ6KRH9_ASPOZ|nr:unnamed protein product [Aspergillus oryzae var. brunneus]